jgi:phosphatidylglycerol---prolipoprotein diacylglyceryl transferase
MDFPVFIKIGSLTIHPHLFFETLAYFIGFRVYLYLRNKERIPFDKAIWIVIGAISGAAIGSKLLYWLEDPFKTFDNLTNLTYLMAGKTIVGGLLGGLIGVETAKKFIGWKRSTGDDFVIPLIVGMCIGRIGCFLTGLSDHTHGNPTDWITGVDFGDGVPRHPTQLYEITYLLVIGSIVIALRKKKLIPWEGFLFQFFMLAYLLFRFFIDFIKPTPHPYGIFNHIQIAAAAGVIYYIVLINRKRKEQLQHAE